MKMNELNLVTIACQSDLCGKGLTICYSYAHTPWGEVLVASVEDEVCYLAFSDEEEGVFERLSNLYPQADLVLKDEPCHLRAIEALSLKGAVPVKLSVVGTEFQVAVWQELLKIPVGVQTSYGAIALALNKPQASRAVGTAIGANPVAILVPCHRVIRASGTLGGYRWGLSRKEALLKWEKELKENSRKIEHRVTRALELFKSGYNCSQSIVAAFADLYGFSEEQAFRMSASFGGGIGRMRETCGAACGLFLLAGLENGAIQGSDKEGKAANYTLVQELAAEFKKRNGSLNCGELLGLKTQTPVISIPEERTAHYYAKRPCVRMIEEAALIWVEYLEKHPKRG